MLYLRVDFADNMKRTTAEPINGRWSLRAQTEGQAWIELKYIK